MRENIPEVCDGEGGCLNLDRILSPCLEHATPGKVALPSPGRIPTLLPDGFREVRECPAEEIPYLFSN